MHFKILIALTVLSGVLSQETTVPDDTTTTPPTTTTSTTTTTTTTTTTPETTTTTTPATTTPTTTAPKTTTAAPSTYPYYNVTENNITCVMLDGEISFKITYDIGQNKTNATTIKVPKPSDEVIVKGSCEDTDGSQFIEISWDDSDAPSSIRLTFEQSKDEQMWSLSNFSSVISMTNETFVNAVNLGKLVSEVTVEMTPNEVPVNRSFKCYTNLTFKNLTTTLNGDSYTYPIIMGVDSLQVEAFNKISSEDKFVDEVHCDADKIADIVPIAVGCALAALVIIVLVAYIIGRRRRSASYQSV